MRSVRSARMSSKSIRNIVSPRWIHPDMLVKTPLSHAGPSLFMAVRSATIRTMRRPSLAALLIVGIASANLLSADDSSLVALAKRTNRKTSKTPVITNDTVRTSKGRISQSAGEPTSASSQPSAAPAPAAAPAMTAATASTAKPQPTKASAPANSQATAAAATTSSKNPASTTVRYVEPQSTARTSVPESTARSSEPTSGVKSVEPTITARTVTPESTAKNVPVPPQ
jgi:hypothetical protein